MDLSNIDMEIKLSKTELIDLLIQKQVEDLEKRRDDLIEMLGLAIDEELELANEAWETCKDEFFEALSKEDKTKLRSLQRALSKNFEGGAKWELDSGRLEFKIRYEYKGQPVDLYTGVSHPNIPKEVISRRYIYRTMKQSHEDSFQTGHANIMYTISSRWGYQHLEDAKLSDEIRLLQASLKHTTDQLYELETQTRKVKVKALKQLLSQTQEGQDILAAVEGAVKPNKALTKGKKKKKKSK